MTIAKENTDAVYTAEGIQLHTESDFEGMRKAGALAAEILDMITDHVVPGVTTEELDRLCHEYASARNAIPAPLGYGAGNGRPPFPKATCTSVNHVVCHGIPGPKKLVEGDILNIDVTVIVDGWHGSRSRRWRALGNNTSPRRSFRQGSEGAKREEISRSPTSGGSRRTGEGV